MWLAREKRSSFKRDINVRSGQKYCSGSINKISLFLRSIVRRYFGDRSRGDLGLPPVVGPLDAGVGERVREAFAARTLARCGRQAAAPYKRLRPPPVPLGGRTPPRPAQPVGYRLPPFDCPLNSFPFQTVKPLAAFISIYTHIYSLHRYKKYNFNFK